MTMWFYKALIIVATMIMVENFQFIDRPRLSISCGISYLDKTIGMAINGDQIYQVINENLETEKIRIIVYNKRQQQQKQQQQQQVVNKKNYRLNLSNGLKYDLQHFFIDPYIKLSLDKKIFNWNHHNESTTTSNEQQEQQPLFGATMINLLSSSSSSSMNDSNEQNQFIRLYCFKSFDGYHYRYCDYQDRQQESTSRRLSTLDQLKFLNINYENKTHITIVASDDGNLFQIQYIIDDDGDDDYSMSKVVVYRLKQVNEDSANNNTTDRLEFIANLYADIDDDNKNPGDDLVIDEKDNNNNKHYRLISIIKPIPMTMEQIKRMNEMIKRLFNEMFTYGFIDYQQQFENKTDGGKQQQQQQKQIFLVSNQNKRIVTFDSRAFTQRFSSYPLTVIPFNEFFYCDTLNPYDDKQNNNRSIIDDDDEYKQKNRKINETLLKNKKYRIILYVSILISLILMFIKLIILCMGYGCCWCCRWSWSLLTNYIPLPSKWNNRINGQYRISKSLSTATTTTTTSSESLETPSKLNSGKFIKIKLLKK
ncbi:hypothetical protein DERF_010826 [Dermatophagoides farinae]|uniref:Uncharacterized protein n=1 Tax=Dermatophagoides farinae TaxID=6954 RepID=A0A922L475_DERFA|nr:hypothetical protein DERF_010826 [Dermatophagoides farinae]